MDNSAELLKNYFYGWQCRVRQHTVRKEGGRPSSGMQAELYVKVSDRNLGPINTGLVQLDSEDITKEFRHINKKTFDPKIRRDAALKILSSAYYQHPRSFDDQLTATFSIDSELAALLLEQKVCELVFQQYQQSFRVHCAVSALSEDDAGYQSTYWHNKMFNATLPAAVSILSFRPNWTASSADPVVTR
ncbi:hypothetical protein AB833_12855 [Chromatiales bacterium (ex Bugula neritina AB1)]|nr:hypothetical protein AB833_12855 [Chromatiales bacterium (ex Bugula neritina AB1)]